MVDHKKLWPKVSASVLIVCYILFEITGPVYCAKASRKTRDLFYQRSSGRAFRNTRDTKNPVVNVAIERLTEVFKIDKLPIHKHTGTPPQYMTDLYRTVAYSDGITKSKAPYQADIVRGIPDKATTHQMHYYFNVSHIKDTEDVLEAEFHIFKLRPLPPQAGEQRLRGIHLIELKLYQVLDENHMYSSSGLRLIDHRRISAHAYGEEVFKITDVVKSWINKTSANQGLFVTATSRTGLPVNGTHLRFAQRSEHHDSKQPVLVVFTAEHEQNGPSFIKPSNTGATQEFMIQGQSNNNMQNYIQSLNEGFRAQHGQSIPVDGTADNQSPLQQENRRRGRSKRAVDNYFTYPRKKKHTCQRHELYVDFDEIGWSGWIISPKGYNAYHCKGECPFPLGQNQKPTNHATVQSIVHALRIGKNVETPCCVPNKLYSISLLYFDDDENVILKQYDGMVAASCGCH